MARLTVYRQGSWSEVGLVAVVLFFCCCCFFVVVVFFLFCFFLGGGGLLYIPVINIFFSHGGTISCLPGLNQY